MEIVYDISKAPTGSEYINIVDSIVWVKNAAIWICTNLRIDEYSKQGFFNNGLFWLLENGLIKR